MKRRTLTGLVILLAILTYLFVPAAFKLYKLTRQNDRLELEVQALSTRNQMLMGERRLLVEDPVYIEHVARQTFKKARKGETVYRLVSAEDE